MPRLQPWKWYRASRIASNYYYMDTRTPRGTRPRRLPDGMGSRGEKDTVSPHIKHVAGNTEPWTCATVQGWWHCATVLLPVDDVAAGILFLRSVTHNELEPLIDYLDNTFVTGVHSSIQVPPCADGTLPHMLMRRFPPSSYPPSVWNVHDKTIAGRSRTNDAREGWNNVFRSEWGGVQILIRNDAANQPQAAPSPAAPQDM